MNLLLTKIIDCQLNTKSFSITDKNNNLLFYKSDCSDDWDGWVYNDNNKPIKIFKKSGCIAEMIYDDSGLLIEEKVYGNPFKFYEYNEDGNSTKVLDESKNIIESNEYFTNGEFAGKLMWNKNHLFDVHKKYSYYRKDDGIVLTRIDITDGSIKRTKFTEHDKNGNLIKDVIDDGCGKEPLIDTYEYDIYNRLSFKKSYWGDALLYKTAYSYYANTDETTEILCKNGSGDVLSRDVKHYNRDNRVECIFDVKNNRQTTVFEYVEF